MLAEQRTEVILSELAERRAVSVTDLCQATGASEATIRRDLNALARQRRLNKVHGGAVLIEEEYHVMEPDMEIKRQLYTEERTGSPGTPWDSSRTTMWSIWTPELLSCRWLCISTPARLCL